MVDQKVFWFTCSTGDWCLYHDGKSNRNAFKLRLIWFKWYPLVRLQWNIYPLLTRIIFHLGFSNDR